MNKLFKLAAAATVALSLSACGSGSDDTNKNESASKTINVGATTSPHAVILEEAKKIMEKDGYTLEITEFSDYPNINPSTSDGSLDANYFQHQPYLDSYNADSGYSEGDDGYLVSAGSIHYEPMGAYSETLEEINLDNLKEGDQIVVPNDATNEARALFLLQDLGVITLNDDATIDKATVADIKDNPKNVEIVEIAADQIPSRIKDVAVVVVNGNYALDADITDYLRAQEASDSDAAKLYANVIAVKEANKDNEAVQELVKVLKSDDIKAFIVENFGDTVQAAQ
ncbi:YaeC family lipoprotein [Firmicutes bacterium M10-2]|nr:YaeC family lipoprotein [Firmicutes bacterium M10-2]